MNSYSVILSDGDIRPVGCRASRRTPFRQTSLMESSLLHFSRFKFPNLSDGGHCGLRRGLARVELVSTAVPRERPCAKNSGIDPGPEAAYNVGQLRNFNTKETPIP